MTGKAQEVLQKLTPSEKESIKRMNPFGKNQFITEGFGNDSEKFGISFGLFPLWVKEVLDEIAKE